MSSLPPELADSVVQLRVSLVEINGAEQTCMTNAVAGASQDKRLPEVQAMMARCRQTAAAAATAAIDTFRHECSEIGAQANSLTNAAIADAAAKSVLDFWIKSESYAAALASEEAALLPAPGPDKTTQAITNTYSDRASSINRYFEQFTTQPGRMFASATASPPTQTTGPGQGYSNSAYGAGEFQPTLEDHDTILGADPAPALPPGDRFQ
jgi:hypothetical protein